MAFPYLDSDLGTSERVADLLQRMTLEEKVGQMMQLAAQGDDHEGYIERYKLGSYLHAVGGDVDRLEALNQQRSRLGIPLIFGIDAIHGHCLEDLTTVFPVQLAMACSWNPSILTEMGKITANEARASKLHWTFSPVLCVGRDPRWGRTSETFGEDPTLIAELAAALVDGYQHADYPLAACAKHYAAYGETSGGRDSADANVSERQMRDVFLPPFERLARSGCKTFMAGYQSLNGIPCSANTWLMNTVLREEWQYQGVVVTDWNNCGQMVELQSAATDIKEAVALCLEASNDVFMSTPDFFECTLALVREGRIPEDRIDQSVVRVLTLKFELGLFEAQAAPDRSQLLSDSGRWQVALEAARQSITMVKNDSVLPLSQGAYWGETRKLRKILLVGDNADNVLNQLGDWSFMPGMAAYTDTQTHRADTVTLKAALDAHCDAHGIALEYIGADYCGPLCSAPAQSKLKASGWLEALSVKAGESDLIVFCAGDALKQYGEFHDRADLEIPGNQNAIFENLQASGTPVVSILLMSKPHCINRILEQSASVLIAFNPGAKGGTALVECLFGAVNPSGRLPISFPRHVGQLPVYYNQAPGWHAPVSPLYDGKARYIDLPQSPLLAFGEGMGYSAIQYAQAQLSADILTSQECVRLTVSVRNLGGRTAVELVQLYCSQVIQGVTSPAKRLLSFQRVTIEAGAELAVSFELAASDLMVWNRHLISERYSGTLTLMVGSSSRSEDLQHLGLSVAPEG